MNPIAHPHAELNEGKHLTPLQKDPSSAQASAAHAKAADAKAADSTPLTSGEAGLRLIALHGLSRRPLVLEASELLASNGQLRQMKQSVNTKKWVVRPGGLRLSRRVLLLAPPSESACRRRPAGKLLVKPVP